MAEAKSRDNWNHTASILALIINVNRDPKKHRAVSPKQLNPYEQRSGKKDTKLAFKYMKALWCEKENHVQKTQS